MKEISHYIKLLEINKLLPVDLLDIHDQLQASRRDIEYMNLKHNSLLAQTRETSAELAAMKRKYNKIIKENKYKDYVIKNYQDFEEYLAFVDDSAGA